MTKQEANRILVSILTAFADSSLYEDYQREDGWTDEEFLLAVESLRTEVSVPTAEEGDDAEVANGHTYEFATEAEADAFIAGLEAVYNPGVEGVEKNHTGNGRWAVTFEYEDDC